MYSRRTLGCPYPQQDSSSSPHCTRHGHLLPPVRDEFLVRGLSTYVAEYFSRGTTVPSVTGPHLYRSFTITLRHHHSRQASSERVISPLQRPLPESTERTQRHKNISMPTAEFEPATPASERPQNHALDRASTGIGLQN